jgi:peptidoglycan/xylan/chitin deacetylase (PgdA/CDA1 family)
MPTRRGSRLAQRPPRRRAALLFGGIGLTALLAVAGGIRDADSPGTAALPGTAAPPPSQPSLDEEAPDTTPGPLTPEEAESGVGPHGDGRRGPDQARVTPSGPHLAVPILLYHYVRTNPRPGDRAGFRLSVTPANFASQVALLRAGGAHTISLTHLMRALQGLQTLPSHPVVLTFDDGHDDFATTAAPLLAAQGMTATNFVVSGFLGRPGYMSAAQVRWVRTLGMTVGAHTMSHADLTRLPPSIARAQIETSRRVLEELTGATVDDFAYPYGRHNAAVDRMTAQAGFRDAVSTTGGELQYLSQRFQLRRLSVTGLDTLASFAAKVRLPLPGRPATAPGPSGGPDPRPAGGAEFFGLPLRRS